MVDDLPAPPSIVQEQHKTPEELEQDIEKYIQEDQGWNNDGTNGEDQLEVDDVPNTMLMTNN